MKIIKINRAGRIFDTIADICSLFMALLYISYVALLLIFDIGTKWLNYTMLAITVAYIVFFTIKIFTLNRILSNKKINRGTRMALKYSKWSMKLINAVFVILSIATSQYAGNNIIAVVGIFIVGFSFLISILWDIAWFVIRTKLRELKTGWDDLSAKEKNKRIELVINTLVKSIDEFAGLDITKSVAKSAERIAVRAQENDNEPVNNNGSCP
jgi:hypothetical protein